MEKEDCIATSVWVERFGTIDMHYFKEDMVVLDDYTKEYVERNVILAVRRIFQAIEKDDEHDSNS